MNLPDPEHSGAYDLFHKGDKLNVDMFNLLTHTTISSQRDYIDFIRDCDESEREINRHIWEQYLYEMSIFYFDLFTEYLVALSKCGNFSVDDVIFFNDLLGKQMYVKLFYRGLHDQGGRNKASRSGRKSLLN